MPASEPRAAGAGTGATPRDPGAVRTTARIAGARSGLAQHTVMARGVVPGDGFEPPDTQIFNPFFILTSVVKMSQYE